MKNSRRDFLASLARASVAVPVFRSNALTSVLRAEHLAAGKSAPPLAEDDA